MIRHIRTLAFLLVVTLLVPAALAAEVQEGRIINAVFSLENGETADFRIPHGGTVKLTHDETGKEFTLGARVLDDGTVEMVLEEQHGGFTKERWAIASDLLQLEVGGAPQKSHLAPFSLQVTGITTEAKVVDKARAPAPDPVNMEVEAAITCCVYCGGWRICCTPSPGYCCTISTSCGISCTVCQG